MISSQAGHPTVRVRVGDRDQVVGVTVSGLTDDLRQPAALAEAVRQALTSAMAERRPAAEDVVDEEGRPRALRVTVPARRPLRELVQESLHRQSSTGTRPRVRLIGGERGESDNGCAWVVLDGSGPGGELDFDPGWLRHAQERNISAAIEQAFAAAYDERNRR